MENLLLKGQVTATSKKQNEKFKADTPKKTAYLLLDEEDVQKAVDFGMTKYTSKEDGKDFFIVKLPQNVSIYVRGAKGVEPEKIDGGIDTPNFKTEDGKFLNLNIIKGQNLGNDFFRLQAIQITDSTDIQDVVAENPFND